MGLIKKLLTSNHKPSTTNMGSGPVTYRGLWFHPPVRCYCASLQFLNAKINNKMSYPNPKYNLQNYTCIRNYHQTKPKHRTSLLFQDRNLQNFKDMDVIWQDPLYHEFVFTVLKCKVKYWSKSWNFVFKRVVIKALFFVLISQNNISLSERYLQYSSSPRLLFFSPKHLSMKIVHASSSVTSYNILNTIKVCSYLSFLSTQRLTDTTANITTNDGLLQ